MAPGELGEWLVMIGIVLAWWPILFFHWAPPYYRFPLYAVALVALIVIFIRRLRRTREGLEESERMRRADPRSEGDKKL